MKRWFLPVLLLIALGALALRLPQLGLRPMHNDENVNAIKIDDLWERGHYQYDPNEFHGPSLYYATLPFIWLSPAKNYAQLSEATLRLVPVFFGVLLVLLLWFLRDALGRAATLGAAGLTAISPAMVFYSRYYIHEMLLVCFTMLALVGVWRYLQTRRAGWAAVAGAGLGLMYATKETFVLELVAMSLALAATWGWNRWRGEPTLRLKAWWNPRHFWLAAGVVVVVGLLLFTSFFTHLRGPLDSILTYFPWTKRAGGHTSHLHPWYYYFQHLFFYHQQRGAYWSEGFVLVLAIVGWLAAATGKKLRDGSVALIRFLGFYMIFLAAIYSVISYKTPWCFLGFYHAMILLAGVGAAVLFQIVQRSWARVVVGGLLVAGAGHLGWEALRANFGHDRLERLYAADTQNPYVYAQTVPDILELVAKVKGIARISPDGDSMLIKVMAPGGDYLPLPWYLRQFKRVGWWNEMPADPYAPVMIVSANFDTDLAAKSNNQYRIAGMFSMRERAYFVLYVQADLFEKYVHQSAGASSAGR